MGIAPAEAATEPRTAVDADKAAPEGAQRFYCCPWPFSVCDAAAENPGSVNRAEVVSNRA